MGCKAKGFESQGLNCFLLVDYYLYHESYYTNAIERND